MNHPLYRTMLAGCSIVALAAVFAVPARAQDAATLFRNKCSACHGPDGGGTAVGKSLGAPDLRSKAVQSQTDAQLKDVIAYGKGQMPPNSGKLTDDQISQMVKYVRDLAKESKKK